LLFLFMIPPRFLRYYHTVSWRRPHLVYYPCLRLCRLRHPLRRSGWTSFVTTTEPIGLGSGAFMFANFSCALTSHRPSATTRKGSSKCNKASAHRSWITDHCSSMAHGGDARATPCIVSGSRSSTAGETGFETIRRRGMASGGRFVVFVSMGLSFKFRSF
jgi:hypothetical protein